MLPPDTHPAGPADAAAVQTPGGTKTWTTVGEVILCSGFPTQFAIGGLLQAAGLAPLTSAGQLSATFIFALSLLDAVLLLSLITFFLWRRGEQVKTVVFGDRPVVQEAAFGVFSVPLVVTIVVVLSLLIRVIAPRLRNVPANPLEALLGTPAGLIVFLLVVIVAGGIREEVQRAFLLHRFRQDLGGVYRGLMITSLAFGLGHTLQGWDATLITGVLGATWGLMYISRGSAVAGMVSHSVFNSGELLRAFLAK